MPSVVVAEEDEGGLIGTSRGAVLPASRRRLWRKGGWYCLGEMLMHKEKQE
jgi:hypothetical protein